MEIPDIVHKFIENVCEIEVPITKRIKHFKSCDIFVLDSLFVFVCDIETTMFNCPRKFDLTDLKNISICFNSESWKFTCTLPCEGESKEESQTEVQTCLFNRITDSCILLVDGNASEIEADFPYGFSARYRGKPKFNEDDLSQMCRISDPSKLSHVQRTIQRENDETKDFCPNQYKLSFVQLEVPEGHDDPMTFEIPYDVVDFTEDDKCILEHINGKHTDFNLETDQTFNIDCDLVSVILGICYDIRFTSNDPTCVSSWTRTILSATLSYFERFEDLGYVIESFIRRSLIYPLYRKYELSRLCAEDVVIALQKGKPWILKQLLITYNCFSEAEFNGKALNKYFIRHLIWYVDAVMDDAHFQMLSTNLNTSLSSITKKCIRLGIEEIEFEVLMELISEVQLGMETDQEHTLVKDSNEEVSESDSEESISIEVDKESSMALDSDSDQLN